MPKVELLPLFIEPLNRAGFRYMVTGSLAATAYGEPRLTLDVDVVLELEPGVLPRFASLFPATQFYCPPEDVLLIECRRVQRGHFNLIHLETGLKADIYLAGRDSLHTWALERRHAIDVEGQRVWFVPVEYVIVRKLQYFQEGGSEKHLHDLRGILRSSGEKLNAAWLEQTIHQHGLEHSWKICQSKQ